MHIELRAVSKRFGSTRALDRVSLEIEPGQIVVLLGANGAGKTTLLRLLAGVISPDSGDLHFDGVEFRRDDLALRRRFFFLPDFPALLPEESALHNIALILRVYGADAPGVEQKVLELLREFELLPHAEAPVQTLSRGQIYKVALTALIATDPPLWLLDEPLASGMDPMGLVAFRRHAREATQRGRTLVYSTQVLEAAERFGDRVCLLHEGEIRAFQTLDSLRGNPGDVGILEPLFARLREDGR